MVSVHLAACQYHFEALPDWATYEAHWCALIEQAVSQGAQLLLLPEYAAMGLTALLAEDECADLQASILGLQRFLPQWLALNEALARRWQIYLCPGSAPVLDEDGCYRNRSWLFGPEGCLGSQDKLIMTRFEREQWYIQHGEGLQVFATELGKLGILICYDNEFPLLARQLAEAGVELILAPSCTDTEAGYHRVRIGAQARALENQIAVLQAPTVGKAAWSPAVDDNIGRAALYGPPDYGLPADGVVAQSASLCPEQSQWLLVNWQPERWQRVRQQGQVLTRRDWPEQLLPGRVQLKAFRD